MPDVRDEDVERVAGEVVSRLYRRFKEWSLRGFGPDDVTWCEVRADIEQMIALPTSGYEKGWEDCREKAAALCDTHAKHATEHAIINRDGTGKFWSAEAAGYQVAAAEIRSLRVPKKETPPSVPALQEK